MKTKITKNFISFISFIIIVLIVLLLFTCTKSKELQEIEKEIEKEKTEINSLIEETKKNNNTISESIYPRLESYALLVLSYYTKTGEIEEDLISKTINFIEYYKEYGQYDAKPSSFRVILPVFYALNASVNGDDFIHATEQVKMSIRGFDELLDEHPEDLIVKIYQAISIANFPRYFKTKEKALDEFIEISKTIDEKKLNDRIPQDILKTIYRMAHDLADDLDNSQIDYFAKKLKTLKP